MDILSILIIVIGLICLFCFPKGDLKPFLIKFSYVFIIPVLILYAGIYAYDSLRNPYRGLVYTPKILDAINAEIAGSPEIKITKPVKQHKTVVRHNEKWI